MQKSLVGQHVETPMKKAPRRALLIYSVVVILVTYAPWSFGLLFFGVACAWGRKRLHQIGWRDIETGRSQVVRQIACGNYRR